MDGLSQVQNMENVELVNGLSTVSGSLDEEKADDITKGWNKSHFKLKQVKAGQVIHELAPDKQIIW